MFWGLLNLSLTGYVCITLIFVQITIACVTLYLHRSQTHQAVSFHPAINHFFRFWLWLTTGMITKEWVAIHRKHHAKSETPEDPHSPRNWGLKTMLFKGAMVYRKGKTDETINTYGYGTPNDWIEKNLYSKHEKLGIFILLFMNIILLGIPGLLVWLIQMAWIPFWAAGIINGVGHRYGYRNFETNDSSTNIIPWGFFIGGEELHNNHHAFGTSAKFSIKWWEFDIGWLYIKILSFLGLAQVKRKFSLLEKTETPHPIDFNLLRIITTNRLQILTHFCRQVIEPVFHEEQKHHQFSANEKKILLTPDVLLDPVIDQKRTEILNKSSAINTVYQFKISLQKIWGNTALHSDDMVNLLKQWVSAAQNSDNIWLNRFTTNLHYY